MQWLKRDATRNHAQFRLPDKDYAIKGLFVSYSWDVNAFEPARPVLRCYQPSPDVCIVNEGTKGLFLNKFSLPY